MRRFWKRKKGQNYGSEMKFVSVRKFVLYNVLLMITVCIYCQSAEDKNKSLYLFPEFTEATVKLKVGNKKNAIMNYNTITGKMVFKRNNEIMDLINIESIDTIYLQQIKFIPFNKIFLEIAIEGKILLLIEHKGNLLPAGNVAAFGETSRTSSTTSLNSLSSNGGTYNLKTPGYNVEKSNIYWIKVNDTFEKITNEKPFLKLFPDKKILLRNFIRDNRIRFSRKDDLIKIIRYYNNTIPEK